MSSQLVTDLLAEDCSNMMANVKSQTEQNTERIENLTTSMVNKDSEFREIVHLVTRLNENVKALIGQDRQEKIMWVDLDTLKQETLNAQKYLGDKINLNFNRMVEFELRLRRLENHFSVNFEKLTKQHD